MFAIASDEKLDVWRQLEVLFCNWRKIEELRDTGLTRIGLSLARRTSVRYTGVPPQRSCFPSQ